MDETNINWVLAIACLLAGIGIGALGYHLLNAGAGNTQRLRQRLAERERELAELKDGLGDHLRRVGELAEGLQRDGQALARELDGAASALGGDGGRHRTLELSAAPDPASAPQEAAGVDAPRDYADGNRGTLSEDFGLRNGDEAAAPQPPRY